MNKNVFTEKQRVVMFATKFKTVVKDFIRVTQLDGSYDLYQDTIVIDNATGLEEKVSHISLHRSGCTNGDYISPSRITHVHQRKNGSTYIYDQDTDTGKKRYYDAEDERA